MGKMGEITERMALAGLTNPTEEQLESIVKSYQQRRKTGLHRFDALDYVYLEAKDMVRITNSCKVKLLVPNATNKIDELIEEFEDHICGSDEYITGALDGMSMLLNRLIIEPSRFTKLLDDCLSSPIEKQIDEAVDPVNPVVQFGEDNYINVQTFNSRNQPKTLCINANIEAVTIGQDFNFLLDRNKKYKTSNSLFYIDGLWWNHSLQVFSVSGRYFKKQPKNYSVHICKLTDILNL